MRTVAKRAGYADGAATSTAATVRGVTVDRLAGDDRMATAIAVSRDAWPSGATTVMLATSLDFADALSGAAAAGKATASLLLTPAASLPSDVAAEIKRLAPSRVVLVGGAGVLSTTVSEQVARAVPTAKIERLAGADRYATSRAAAELSGTSADVFIATGRDYPDALSAAAVGNSIGAPVILVDGSATRLDSAMLATLKKIEAGSATIVGGTGVVSPQIEQALKSTGLTVTRLAGADRYATNDAVVQHHFPASALKTLFASGMGFADALPASVLAGRWKLPLLLTAQSCVVPTAADFIQERGTESVVLVGGSAVLDAGVAALRRC